MSMSIPEREAAPLPARLTQCMTDFSELIFKKLFFFFIQDFFIYIEKEFFFKEIVFFRHFTPGTRFKRCAMDG